MKHDRPIHYEPHPVTAERKAELVAQGVQIVDAIYKPAGAPADALLEEGPTVAEYVAAGYLAVNYPPQGYASRSTPEEIEEAVTAQQAAGKFTAKHKGGGKFQALNPSGAVVVEGLSKADADAKAAELNAPAA